MCDNSTGIKLTRNLEQGNRYKETFIGMPVAGKELPCIWHATLQWQGSYCTAFMVKSVVAQWKVLVQPSSLTPFSCSLDTWKHTQDPMLLVNLALHWQSLWRCQNISANEGLRGWTPSVSPWKSTLPWYESCLSPCRFCPGGLAHLQQLCRVTIRGRHLGIHADGGELHQARGSPQHWGHALQWPLWAVPWRLHRTVHVCKWCSCQQRHLLYPLSHAWLGAVVKGTRTACSQKQNTQAMKVNTEGAALGF